MATFNETIRELTDLHDRAAGANDQYKHALDVCAKKMGVNKTVLGKHVKAAATGKLEQLQLDLDDANALMAGDQGLLAAAEKLRRAGVTVQ